MFPRNKHSTYVFGQGQLQLTRTSLRMLSELRTTSWAEAFAFTGTHSFPHVCKRSCSRVPPLYVPNSLTQQLVTPAPYWHTMNHPPKSLKSGDSSIQSLLESQRFTMPVDYSGTWDIVSNVNFEGYMVALGEFDGAANLFLFVCFIYMLFFFVSYT